VIIKPSTIIKKGKKSIHSGDEIQIGEILLKLLAIDQDPQLQTMGVDVQELFNQSKENPQK